LGLYGSGKCVSPEIPAQLPVFYIEAFEITGKLSYNSRSLILLKGGEQMIFDGDMTIDDKRYEDIIKIGYESARKNIDEFEGRCECSFENLTLNIKQSLTPEEVDEWRICLMVVSTLKDKVN
jgi:hypothetical protein